MMDNISESNDDINIKDVQSISLFPQESPAEIVHSRSEMYQALSRLTLEGVRG